MEEVGTLKFTWKIENFSNLHTDELYSDVFSLGPYKWRIIVHPEGGDEEFLKIFLLPGSEILWSGCSRSAKFSFTLINQTDKKLSVTKDSGLKQKFDTERRCWGFCDFISLGELHDPNKGYVVDDTCIIEASVTVYGDVSVESHGTCKEIRIEDPIKNATEEDIDVFFGDLQSDMFEENIFSVEQEEKAQVVIEEALNMVPSDVMNNPDGMALLRNAFDVLSTVDNASILTSEQKAELVSMKYNFIALAERAAGALQDKNSFALKEVIKTTLDCRIDRCQSELEKAEDEIMQNRKKIAVLTAQINTMRMNNEFSLLKQKQMLKVSKKLEAERNVMVQNWPAYEAKSKAAEEEENVVGKEWSKMKQLFLSLKNPCS